MNSFFEDYENSTKTRQKQGIPPLPLNMKQTNQVIELLKSGSNKQEYLLDLLENRVLPGVDEAAFVKANFMHDILRDKVKCDCINKEKAIFILGTMFGGYNVKPLIKALKSQDEKLAKLACDALKNIILIYDSFEEIKTLSETNIFAKEVLLSWANAEWFTCKNKIPTKITCAVLKVDGETNTDDLSPASEAFTRSDIPLHAKSMLSAKMPNAQLIIQDIKNNGYEVAYVGDVVGTGSSRKSGINSIQWHIGKDIPYVPNKKTGGIILGSTIAPIFFNTAEDSGALPICVDVNGLENGDIIEIYPYDGKLFKDNKLFATFSMEPNTIFDEFRVGGRISLIIGRDLTNKARKALGLENSDIFIKPKQPIIKNNNTGYTQAQKMVGQACGVDGVRAGMYIEPKVMTVGSQDTTGPMTRDEIVELAAINFSADFVLQSFCHTAAYPKPSDIQLQHTLPSFINRRRGVSLKAGDGVIHSWLNRMVLPDSVGTGGDSHTRFPIGISFPAGSGLVAFAAVTGTMPLNMPESVLVRFKGEIQPGVTLRDIVNAIPYFAIKQGLLTVPKKDKKNIFAGKIIEIEGLSDLKVEQAFELSDASAERSAAACSIDLGFEPVIEYLKSNVVLIESMINAGYQDAQTLKARAEKMKKWIENPTLVRADKNAEYSAILEINLSEIKEPILACPNDPDDVATLSEILNDTNRPKNIDEVFVGSCMTNIGHYRALGEILRDEGQAAARLWIAPPTKMDQQELKNEGYYSIFGAAGARIEVAGCSLCMGNQARVQKGSIVFSTSTRNFNNRMGIDTKVYLGSAELAAVCALLGRLPSVEEYMDIVLKKISTKKEYIYKYLNFNLMDFTFEQ